MRRLIAILGAVFVPVLTLVAQLPPTSPASFSGGITINGDPALAALSQNIVLLYSLEGYSGSATVTPTSSAEGFAGLCTGTVDIVMATRLINQQEQSACISSVITPVEFRVGTDALIVLTSPQNTFLQNLTTTELQLAFSTALNWSDVNPAFPSEPINRYTPSPDTGEFTFFVDAVFGGDASRALAATNNTQSADLNTLLQTLGGDTNGIGFIPASIANRNSSIARSVTLDGIGPNTQAVTSGTYPLTRPLLLYSSREAFSTKPQVADFLNYYLTNVSAEVAPLGLYPASLQAAFGNWLAASGVQPTPTPQVALPTLAVPGQPTPAPEATEDPTTSVAQTFEDDTLSLLIDARSDLELLASNALGLARPGGWSGSLDTNNPQLALLIRLDLETLATATLGETNRPAGWFGPVPSTLYAIARDIRHDLELLADTLNENGQRPDGWAGGPPILRCDRATQTLAALLERGGVYTPSADPASPDYCQQVAVSASVFTEVNLLANVSGEPIFNQAAQAGFAGAQTIRTNFAVAFLDRGAALQVGVIPNGTPIRAVGRSTAQFSRMVLVEGEGFALFVDYNDTTLTEDEFRRLEDASSVGVTPFCEADFCGG